MKYFIDTEFLEGTQKEKFPFNLIRKETKPTIELISIGVVAEDGREYYAISKDFNLKEAWNRYQLIDESCRDVHSNRKYWIRDNVLKQIWIELSLRKNPKSDMEYLWNELSNRERYIRMKLLISLYGKSNQQIAKEVKDFVSYKSLYGTNDTLIIEGKTSECRATYEGRIEILKNKGQLPKFYGYYADYDWVVFCWLFGYMKDLPGDFPMYCRDLKQTLDEKYMLQENKYPGVKRLNAWLQDLKKHPDYPKQENEHNALADAKWNKKLYEFLKQLK